MRKSIEVEVDIELDEVIHELSDRELYELGFCKRQVALPLEQQWLDVRMAIRSGDHRQLVSLLTTMAWDQVGIVIPVVGIPALH
ncbi:MAG: hypothetical protein WA777_15150 [Rhodanobacter sp.]